MSAPVNSAAALGSDTPWADVPAMLGPAYAETWLMVGVVMTFTVLIGGLIGVLLFNASPRGLFPHRPTRLALG